MVLLFRKKYLNNIALLKKSMISMNYQFILRNLSLVVSVIRMLLCKCIYYVSRTVIINIFSVTFYGLVGIAT
jgi:hypothetical protein